MSRQGSSTAECSPRDGDIIPSLDGAGREDNILQQLTVQNLTVLGTETITTVDQIPYGARPSPATAGDLLVNSGSNFLEWYDGTTWHTTVDAGSAQTISGSKSWSSDILASADNARTIGSSALRFANVITNALTLYAAASDAQPAFKVSITGAIEAGAGGASATDLRLLRTGSKAFALQDISGGYTATFTTGPTTVNGNVTITPAATVAASASAYVVLFDSSNATTQFTGGQQTGDVYGIRLQQVTISDDTAATVMTNAATHVISGAPIAGTNVTITNKYAQWIKAGITKFDGPVVFNTTTPATSNTTITILPVASPGVGSASKYSSDFIKSAGTVTFTTTNQTGDFVGMQWDPTTIANPTATATITNAASFNITGLPIAGTNTVITNNYGLWLQGGAGATKGTMIRVESQTAPVGDSTTHIINADYSTSTVGYITTNQTGDVLSAHHGSLTINNPTATATITNAATVKIDSAPTAGTNTTITNSYSLWVAAGQSRFDTSVMVNNTGQSNAARLTIGTASGPTGNSSEKSILDMTTGTVTFATNAQTGDFHALRVGIATLVGIAGSAITNAASLRIDGAPVASTNVTFTNAYALLVSAGATLLNGGTITTSGSFTTINGTWNASGVAFPAAFLVNITNTASATGTALADFQIGGTSRYLLTKNGRTIQTFNTTMDSGSGSTHINISIPAVTTTFNPNQTGDLYVVDYAQQTLAQNSSATIPNAATMVIEGTPIASTNVTFSSSAYYGLWIKAAANTNASGTITNAASLKIDGAPTTAGTITNAFGADISGNVALRNSVFAGTSTQSNGARFTVAPSPGPTGSASARDYGMIIVATTIANVTSNQTGDVSGGRIQQMTIQNPSATGAITNGFGFVVDAAPITSTNTTIANTIGLQVGGATTIASATAATYNAINVPAHTVTITGSTAMTTAQGMLQLGIPTLSAGSAMTLTTYATLRVAGAPAAAGAGPLTITNAYALHIAAGNSQFDGVITVNGTATSTQGRFGAGNNGLQFGDGTNLNDLLMFPEVAPTTATPTDNSNRTPSTTRPVWVQIFASIASTVAGDDVSFQVTNNSHTLAIQPRWKNMTAATSSTGVILVYSGLVTRNTAYKIAKTNNSGTATVSYSAEETVL